MGTASRLVAAAVLVAATLGINAPALDYGFAYDDQAVVLDRAPCWDEGLQRFLESRHWGIGRHAVLASFDLDRREPLEPRPFHLTNVALAALVVVAVYALALALGLGGLGAFAGALLFAVHPLHVDAVVSIVGRAEVLSGLGVIACLFLHARGYPPAGFGLLPAGLLFLLALSSKESAACLLPLLVLYDCLLGRGRRFGARIAAYVTYGLSLAAWLVVTLPLLGDVDPVAYVDNPLAHVDATQRIPAAAKILWSYARLTALPIGLLPDRSYAVTTADPTGGWLALGAWILVAIVCLLLGRRHPLPCFLGLWLPVAFSVTGNLAFPIGTIMSERLAFLPSLGPCLLAGLVIERVASTRPRAAVACVALAGAVAFCFVAYRNRAAVWASDETYHEAAVAASPRSAKAHYNLGLVRGRQDRLAEAAESFEKALAIYPGFDSAAFYLAGIQTELKRPEDALLTYRRYLDAVPDDAAALLRLGRIEISLGSAEEALATARRLIAIDPTNAESRELLVQAEQLARRRQSDVSP